MKWVLVNTYRALFYTSLIAAILCTAIVLGSCGEEPADNRGTPQYATTEAQNERELQKIYATAQARISAMQTQIAADQNK